jgi:hypothetical protein
VVVFHGTGNKPCSPSIFFPVARFYLHGWQVIEHLEEVFPLVPVFLEIVPQQVLKQPVALPCPTPSSCPIKVPAKDDTDGTQVICIKICSSHDRIIPRRENSRFKNHPYP